MGVLQHQTTRRVCRVFSVKLKVSLRPTKPRTKRIISPLKCPPKFSSFSRRHPKTRAINPSCCSAHHHQQQQLTTMTRLVPPQVKHIRLLLTTTKDFSTTLLVMFWWKRATLAEARHIPTFVRNATKSFRASVSSACTTIYTSQNLRTAFISVERVTRASHQTQRLVNIQSFIVTWSMRTITKSYVNTNIPVNNGERQEKKQDQMQRLHGTIGRPLDTLHKNISTQLTRTVVNNSAIYLL